MRMPSRLRYPVARKPDVGVIRNAPFELLSPRALMDANNVRVRPGRIEKVRGYTAFSTTALNGAIMLVDVARYFSGTEILIVADTKRLYKYNTSTGALNDVTGSDLTTAAARPHFSGMWKDTLIYSNGLDVVKKWTGAGNIGTLGGLTDAEPGGVAVNFAKCLCPAGPFLLLGNTQEAGANYPMRVRWPKFDTLEVWKNDGSGNGQAGYMDVYEEPSELLNIVPIGNYYAAYKRKSVSLLTYVGLPVIWARRQVVFGRGLLAPKAVVSLGDFHIAAFNDNFYIFNGATLQRIGDSIRDDFFASLDPNYKDLTFALHIEDKGEVVFAYPGLGSTTPNKAVVYNYLLNAWSFRDFPFTAGGQYVSQSTKTWADLSGAWDVQTWSWDNRSYSSNAPLNIVGDVTNKKIFQYDIGDDANGADIDGYATVTLTDFGDPGRVKRATRLKPVCEKLDVDLQVFIVTADRPRGDLTYNGPYMFNPASGTFVDFDLAAHFFGFKMRSPLKNGPFTLSGWEWEISMEEDR